MRRLKKGEYHYARRGQVFRIYVCVESTPESEVSRPAGDEDYFDREEARRRVYELNGWKYRPPEKTTETV